MNKFVNMLKGWFEEAFPKAKDPYQSYGAGVPVDEVMNTLKLTSDDMHRADKDLHDQFLEDTLEQKRADIRAKNERRKEMYGDPERDRLSMLRSKRVQPRYDDRKAIDRANMHEKKR
jgi:hypothetical protein